MFHLPRFMVLGSEAVNLDVANMYRQWLGIMYRQISYATPTLIIYIFIHEFSIYNRASFCPSSAQGIHR